MTLFGPLVLMYTLLSAAVAALIRLIVLNPLSFGLMNYMKKASTDEENANQSMGRLETGGADRFLAGSDRVSVLAVVCYSGDR